VKSKHLLFTLFVFPAVCVAQEGRISSSRAGLTPFDAGTELHGEIKHPPASTVGNLTVEISDPVQHSSRRDTLVSSTGDFEFSGLTPGTYTLRVLSVTGTLITEKLVDLEQSMNLVQVELPKLIGAEPGTGTVSLAQLMHRVPADAMKDYNNALKFIRKRDNEAAMGLLEKAVEIDPQFVEAQADLGRIYIQKHEPEKVLAAFGAVLKVNPRSEVAYAGSSVAQIWLSHFPEAEESARRALEINPAGEASHYFLGLSLAAQDKNDDEAVEHLNKCSRRFPSARITAAELLARHKEFSAASDELQSYLKTGDPERREQVTSWLEELKKAQTVAAK
jgi:Tfp pilus assembly protein PilF